ncbi:hypothetical protein Tco_1492737 [Tanacetum coccineum]
MTVIERADPRLNFTTSDLGLGLANRSGYEVGLRARSCCCVDQLEDYRFMGRELVETLQGASELAPIQKTVIGWSGKRCCFGIDLRKTLRIHVSLMENEAGMSERLGDVPGFDAILLMDGVYLYGPQTMHRWRRSQKLQSDDRRRQESDVRVLENRRREAGEMRETESWDRLDKLQIVQTLTAGQVDDYTGRWMTLHGQVTTLTADSRDRWRYLHKPEMPEEDGSSS